MSVEKLRSALRVATCVSLLYTIKGNEPNTHWENQMEKRIVFVTGNADKFIEVERYLKQIDPTIILEQVNIDLPEYQSLDIHKIALGKAEEAWRLLQKPLLIDDGGIYLERFNNFPGPLAKYVFQGIGLEGFWLLAKDDPRAYFLSCLVYYYAPGSYKFFEGTCYGTIIEPTGVITRKQMPFRDIFIPRESAKIMFIPGESGKTLAQLEGTPEEHIYHHLSKSLRKLVEWLNTSDTSK
jgi:XTP/dITP diphosphohydrolase